MEAHEFRTVGEVTRRKDGLAKVTGTETYASDMELPYMLHARVLRSPYPHARVVSIDTSEAERMGAICITPDDVPDIRYNERQVSVPVKTYRDRTVLPWVVRQVGEGVAAVAARTETLAERAMRAIKVEWEELPAVYDPHKALADDAPPIYENVLLGDVETARRAQHRLLPPGRRRRRLRGLRGGRPHRRARVPDGARVPRPDGAQGGDVPSAGGRRHRALGHAAVHPQHAPAARADLRPAPEQGARAPQQHRRGVRLQHPDEHPGRHLRRARPQGAQAGQDRADARRGHVRPLQVPRRDPPQVRRQARRHHRRRRAQDPGRHRRAQHPGLPAARLHVGLVRLALPHAAHELRGHGRLHQQDAGLRHAGLRQPGRLVRRRVAHGHHRGEARDRPHRAAHQELRRPGRGVLGPGPDRALHHQELRRRGDAASRAPR